MDSNHDKQNQNLLCYRYTTGQTDREGKGSCDRSVAGHGWNKEPHGADRPAALTTFDTPRLPFWLVAKPLDDRPLTAGESDDAS